MMKKGLVLGFLSLVFLGIALLFWRNEWIYNLPTPVPEKYQAVGLGTWIDPPGDLKSGSKPLFLHFFNPDCPCSRFNMTYFKTLVKQYGSQVDFAIVVMNNADYTEKKVQDKYGLQIPVFFDSSIAARCGVYSTPQAVILDPARKLYYRGNYNRSRYCADPKTNYAQQALEGLLRNRIDLRFNRFALTAYGCRLPNCKK
jgi:Iodothyronine deiodinase